MEVRQLKNGAQPRPYADHVWEWEVITDKSEAEVLDYCRKNLKDAKRDAATYLKDYRTKSFDALMDVVCGGYYEIFKTEGGYKYRVVQEYID